MVSRRTSSVRAIAPAAAALCKKARTIKGLTTSNQRPPPLLRQGRQAEPRRRVVSGKPRAGRRAGRGACRFVRREIATTDRRVSLERRARSEARRRGALRGKPDGDEQWLVSVRRDGR